MNKICVDFHFQARTDLWTGDAEQHEKRLINTGLLGSIRWWFEVLVRGLGGAACDPTKTQCSDKKHCAVCELFGCTGWTRKFRFEVLDGNGAIRMGKDNKESKYSPQIKANEKFTLRFTPLRPICEEEWALLEATLRLIAEYGTIGGKTVLKPSNELDRANMPQHQDYGIIKLIECSPSKHFSRSELEKYVRSDRWTKPAVSVGEKDFSWASLQNFWCVKGRCLTRETGDKSSFNHVIGRPESKKDSKNNDSWLAGSQRKRESKRVFSFKNPARTFGFVKPELVTFDIMKQRLKGVWGPDGWNFIEGDEILNSLFSGMEGNK
jgi:CRISPR-associated protein Cmr1